MQKRGQAAMEFVMTYGWAVMISLIAISALGYYISLEQACPPNFQLSDNIVSVTDQKFVGSDAELEQGRNRFYLRLRNNLPRPATIEGIILVERGGVVCGEYTIPQEELELKPGERTHLLQGNISNPACQGIVGACYSFEVKVKYSSSSGFDHIAEGSMKGSFEDVTFIWDIGNWSKTDYSGSIVEDEPSGSKLNYCNKENPPNSGTLIPDSFDNFLIWSLPGNCDSGKFGQLAEGFETAGLCDITSNKLAKGWLHTTLYADSIFAGSHLYLGGNATFNDTTRDGEIKHDGICLNDNLYFYLNGQLKYYGGTTGAINLPKDDIFEAGEEVMRNCGGCEVVDSSAWCIAPFDLTLNGLNYGEENSIDIMIEDFCNGGGMSPLYITMG